MANWRAVAGGVNVGDLECNVDSRDTGLYQRNWKVASGPRRSSGPYWEPPIYRTSTKGLDTFPDSIKGESVSTLLTGTVWAHQPRVNNTGSSNTNLLNMSDHWERNI